MQLNESRTINVRRRHAQHAVASKLDKMSVRQIGSYACAVSEAAVLRATCPKAHSSCFGADVIGEDPGEATSPSLRKIAQADGSFISL